MAIEKIKFSEAAIFAKDNGYWFAVYKKGSDGDFLLVETCLWSVSIDNDTEIIVKTMGKAIDFNEFITADGKFCLRLHNNFNVPKIIPVFKKEIK